LSLSLLAGAASQTVEKLSKHRAPLASTPSLARLRGKVRYGDYRIESADALLSKWL
jgi:hypothetical protein